MMVIKKKKMDYYLLIAIVFFVSIPYLFYGIKASSSDFQIIGSISINMDKISVGTIGRYFVYIKDLLAILILSRLVVKLRKEDFFIIFFILTYGIFVLWLNNRFDYRYIVAGIRTVVFVMSTYLYLIKYDSSIGEIKAILRVLEIVLLIHTAIVIKQIISSGDFSSFGSGAYRYSGAFAGSGNLGCFCMATLLLFFLMYKKYKIVSRIELLFFQVIMLFLSVASGTRTAIIIVGAYFLYTVISYISDFLKLGMKGSNVLYILSVLVIGKSFVSWLVDRIGRGDLTQSGGGRFEILMDFLAGSVGEVFFGHGLGYGTNASINLGIKDTTISDATITLILAQFGIIGVIVFIIFSLVIFYKMLNSYKADKVIGIMTIGLFVVLCLVGNLFEQSAMSVVLTLAIYLNGFEVFDKDIKKIDENGGRLK